MSGKRSGSVRGVLLFEFDTPCKVAHHACVFISGVWLFYTSEAEDADKNDLKSEKLNRNNENRRQIIDFIADNGVSDSKSVSKAIGLKPSRTRDYLKQLVDEGILETEGEYKSRKYKIKVNKK